MWKKLFFRNSEVALGSRNRKNGWSEPIGLEHLTDASTILTEQASFLPFTGQCVKNVAGVKIRYTV